MLRPVLSITLTSLAALVSPGRAVGEEPRNGAATKQIAVDVGEGVMLKLALIPSGEFMMGESPKATAEFISKIYGEEWPEDVFAREGPVHRVRISKSFYMGVYHVTRGQFRQFVKESSYLTDAEKGERPGSSGWDLEARDLSFNKKYSWKNAGYVQTDEHPVVNVSWNDAVAFCEWLGRKQGKVCRLPTEAEWEYACRAGTTTRYSSGDDPETLAKVANVADATLRAIRSETKDAIKASDGYAYTSPVGLFRPNAFGLYDMPGNAWEWCADGYSDQYYSISPTDDPVGPDSSDFRVLRGGCWLNGANASRSATRDWLTPSRRNCCIGFRIVMAP